MIVVRVSRRKLLTKYNAIYDKRPPSERSPDMYVTTAYRANDGRWITTSGDYDFKDYEQWSPIPE